MLIPRISRKIFVRLFIYLFIFNSFYRIDDTRFLFCMQIWIKEKLKKDRYLMVVESICDITIFGEFFKFELLFQEKIMILIAQTPNCQLNL